MKYLLGLAASIIGILLVVLRLQGGKLHKAQIALLFQQLKETDEADKALIASAKAKLQSTLKAYIEAGGEM